MRRANQIAALGEEPVGAATAVLQPRPPARYGEGHVRAPGIDAELAKEPHKVRVGAVVVDEKTRIKRDGAGRNVDDDGVGMAAEPRLFLKDVDAVAPAQEIGRRETGNTRTDYRN